MIPSIDIRGRAVVSQQSYRSKETFITEELRKYLRHLYGSCVVVRQTFRLYIFIVLLHICASKESSGKSGRVLDP